MRHRIHYSSISLGSIVGTVANAMPISTVSAYLNVPGGGVANLLRESQRFRTDRSTRASRRRASQPGITLYEQFFRDAQTVVDAGDPINYIAAAVAARPVLVSQVLNDTVDAELGDAAAHRRRSLREDGGARDSTSSARARAPGCTSPRARTARS